MAIHWNVPLIAQSPEMCWEAVGHMMWLFRYPGDEVGYRKKASRYLKMNRGLGTDECDTFYRTLGMLANRQIDQNWLRHQIHLGPIILLIDPNKYAHAMIWIGRDHQDWIFVNPEAVSSVDFDVDPNKPAKETVQAAQEVRLLASSFTISDVGWWWPSRKSK